MCYTTSPTLSLPIHTNVTAGRRFSKNRHYWIEFVSFVGNNGKDEAKAMLKNQDSINKIKEAEIRSVCQDLPPSMEPESSIFCSQDYASDHYPEVTNPGYPLLAYFFTISLTLYSHLHLGFPSGLFPSCSPVIFFVKFPSRLRALDASSISSSFVLPI